MKTRSQINTSRTEHATDAQQGPVFDATIRWCLLFNDRLSSIDITLDTPCTLLGMIEWHELSRMMSKKGFSSRQADDEITAIEEKIVLLEDGIPCTLRQLQEGSIKARLLLEFSMPHLEQKIFRDSTWGDIHCDRALEMIHALQKEIVAGDTKDTKVLTLACNKARPGGFAQRSLKFRAALALAKGVGLDDIPPTLANRYAARDIINKKEYLVRGARTKFSLQTETGEVVGQHISHLC